MNWLNNLKKQSHPISLTIAVDPGWLARVLFYLTLLLSGISVGGHILQFIYGRDRFVEFVRLFNLGDERNIPSWFISLLFLIASVLLLHIAGQQKRRRLPALPWQVIAAIFLFLSVDAVATIHDHTLEIPMVDFLEPRGIFHFPWVIVGWVIIFILGLSYFRFWLRLPEPTRTLFLVAAILCVGGGLGLEMISAYLMDYHLEAVLLRGVVATLQEMAEMIGVVVFI